MRCFFGACDLTGTHPSIQVLQRDLSVAVLRVFRQAKENGGLSYLSKRRQGARAVCNERRTSKAGCRPSDNKEGVTVGAPDHRRPDTILRVWRV